MLKKRKCQANEAQLALLASRKLVSTMILTRKGAALGYLVAKISLKEDDVPTLFPVVEAMLMPPICRTQAATRALMTTVHLGLKQAVGADTGQHSLESSANFGIRAQWA